MNASIALNPNNCNGRTSKDIQAFSTACPSLFVHKSPDGGWAVSHKESGYRIFGDVKLRALAIEAGDLLNSLPNWDKLTPDNCGTFFQEHVGYLRAVRDFAHGTGPRPERIA